MIIGQRKPLKRIFEMLDPYDRILIAGCGSCVTVCMSGGLKEAEETAAVLRLHRQAEGRPVEVRARVVERQCEPEFLETLDADLPHFQVVLSLACGVGVQRYSLFRPGKLILPGLDTLGSGLPVRQGLWEEVCLGCGDCLLDQTAGVCPITRCAKGLLNGPCGGSRNGRCEANTENHCAWQIIYDRLAARGELNLLEEYRPPKDWSRGHWGGPRRLEREDMPIV